MYKCPDFVRLLCARSQMTDEDGGGSAAETWPCLRGRATVQFSELAEGSTTTVASDAGLMRALVGSYLEAVAEAVLSHDAACRFFSDSSADLELQARWREEATQGPRVTA
jgi:class 3 adenylate cyclase